jgi:hypothetical protein
MRSALGEDHRRDSATGLEGVVAFSDRRVDEPIERFLGGVAATRRVTEMRVDGRRLRDEGGDQVAHGGRLGND